MRTVNSYSCRASFHLVHMLNTARRVASSLLRAVVRKCSRPFVFVLFHVEKTIFLFLYLLSVMEDGDSLVNEELRFDRFEKQRVKIEVNESFENIEMKRLSEADRSISLPNVQDVGKPHHQVVSTKPANPVKEFITNFVSRGRGPRKRAPIKHSATTEDFTAEEPESVPEIKRQMSGGGHVFLPCHLRNPTWCDLCGEFIWGLFKQSVRCKNCKYTCHRRCKEDVELDCLLSENWSPIDKHMSVDEVTLKTLHHLESGDTKKEPFILHSEIPSGVQLRKKIDQFNSTTTGLIMTTRDDTTFQGFIRVHMNLLRPINIIEGERPLSIFEAIKHRNANRTSFFLPHGTVKALHITGETSVHEVIVALLKKFKVADNPRKFAMFECYQEEDNHVIVRSMRDSEHPLVLRLLWGGGDIRHSFSLQENETGDIVWEVFSLPELQNFLKILDREEEEHLVQVQQKYKRYKDSLQRALDLHDGSPQTETANQDSWNRIQTDSP